jgi:hypothetical protein
MRHPIVFESYSSDEVRKLMDEPIVTSIIKTIDKEDMINNI